MWFGADTQLGAKNSGTVFFGDGGVDGGGGTAYFGLEDDLNLVNGTLNIPAVNGVPEPATVTMLGMGVVSLLGYRARRRKLAV
jgi:hypothetical protein